MASERWKRWPVGQVALAGPPPTLAPALCWWVRAFPRRRASIRRESWWRAIRRLPRRACGVPSVEGMLLAAKVAAGRGGGVAAKATARMFAPREIWPLIGMAASACSGAWRHQRSVMAQRAWRQRVAYSRRRKQKNMA